MEVEADELDTVASLLSMYSCVASAAVPDEYLYAETPNELMLVVNAPFVAAVGCSSTGKSDIMVCR